MLDTGVCLRVLVSMIRECSLFPRNGEEFAKKGKVSMPRNVTGRKLICARFFIKGHHVFSVSPSANMNEEYISPRELKLCSDSNSVSLS